MIKYLGSKRRLVPTLAAIAEAAGARTALDLFTGTTRVAQAWKGAGIEVTAADLAAYAATFARCYVATDDRDVDLAELDAVIAALDALPGRPGYVTETFCHQARFFQPGNGERIDAIRAAITAEHAGSPIEPILLTALIEAADRVDSTTGVQMAYLKSWAPRAHQRLSLKRPELLAGAGRALHGDAVELVTTGVIGPVDLAYLDPPYNQHRYRANYHVWETLALGDEPEAYGVARKRNDLRGQFGESAFNRRAHLPAALARCIHEVDARVVVVSFNDEGWVSLPELVAMCRVRGRVAVLGYPQRRYVGAQIGVHNRAGERVGAVSHLHNTEYLVVAGDLPIALGDWLLSQPSLIADPEAVGAGRPSGEPQQQPPTWPTPASGAVGASS